VNSNCPAHHYEKMMEMMQWSERKNDLKIGRNNKKKKAYNSSHILSRLIKQYVNI
jgi:hypothetical protein